MSGKFVKEWQNVLKGSGADLKEVDIANGVSTLLAVKDSEELVRPPVFLLPFPSLTSLVSSQQNERNAANMTAKHTSHFSDVKSGYIGEGKKVTHKQRGEQIEAKLEDSKFWKNLKLGDDVSRLLFALVRRLLTRLFAV